jgi:hypothetical protein
VVKKMGRGGCDAGPVKVEVKITSAQYSASAFQSQISALQVAHLVLRFGIAPHLAEVVSSLPFDNGRAD